MIKRKILIVCIITCAISLGMLLYANYRVNSETANSVYSNVSMIPHNNVGLLLGTSKYLGSGQLNLYFKYRIDAAEALFKYRKIDKIVISGDNSRKDYNEPQDMKDELIKRGIPEENIYLDFAGFRTYDSVYRMKEIFGQSKFTIISQDWHNQRAIYTANALELEAIGFNANDVSLNNGFMTKLREKFARVKTLLDIAFSKKPKFLGEKIIIE